MKPRLFIAAMLLAFTSLWIACSDSEDSVCGGDSDCPTDQVCQDGVCKLPSRVRCVGDPDCSGGERCVDGVCRAISDNNTNNVNNVNNQNNINNNTDMGADFPPDMPRDNVNPEVVSITPADGTTDVAVDAQVEVVFSEAMNPLTVNFQSLVLKNPAGQDVPAMVTYNPDTFTATLVPTAPLNPSSGYRVVPLSTLRDPAGNSLLEPAPEARFYTAANEPANHTALAARFAPVIYQSIENETGAAVNYDLPTTVNFDGDFTARNNKAAAQTSAPTANVYYSVVESKTHYFIVYALYYPVRKVDTTLNEHDFTGVLFVIDKATESFKLAEGLKVDSGNDTIFAWKPDSSDVSGTGQPQILDDFPDADFDGERYPMYIPRGIHAACHWTQQGPAVPTGCFHSSQEFTDGPNAGVIMRPGTAQTYAMAVDNNGQKEMEYGLVPLNSLWARRTDVDNELLWEQLTVYQPIDSRPSRYNDAEEPIVWPNRLVSDDTDTFGKPPFAWLKLSGDPNQGQWLFDPAYIMTVRYNFGTMYSNEYCFNSYLGIDNRGDATHPECPAP